MHPKITGLLRSHTIQQSAITVISTFLSSALGAVFYVLVAKVLGPHSYGTFTLAMIIFALGVTFCEVGMGQGLVRFIGEDRQAPAYFPFAKIALITKIITGSFFLVIVSVFSKGIAAQFFHHPELGPVFPFVGVAVFFQLLFNYSMSVAQGLQKFMVWGGVQVGSNLFRLFLLLVFMMLSLTSPGAAVLLVGFASLSGFTVSWKWLDMRVIAAPVTKDQTRRFWSFNKWTALFIILSSLVSRLDTILTGRLLNLTQTGIYGLSSLMVSFLPQLASAIGVVTSSKFAGIKEHDHAHSYLQKTVLLNLGVSLAVAALMIPTALIFIEFAGHGYAGSFLPFLILLASSVIFMSGNPIRDSLLYYYLKPQFFVYSAVGQGLVLTLLSLFFIPRYGLIGSSISTLGGHIFLLLVSYLFYIRERHARKN